MSNKSIFLLVSILVLIGGAIFFLPSDESKIRDNLEKLAENCSTLAGETVIESLAKATTASKLCTAPCRVEITSRNTNKEFSQKEISDNILILKKRLPDTTFVFQDINIDILSDTTAFITATIQLNGSTQDGRFTDAYEVDIEAVKEGNNWFFSSFTVVEFMVK